MYSKKDMLKIIEQGVLPYMTIDMVSELFYEGGSYHSASKVVRTLYDRGYLGRFSCKMNDHVGRGATIYYPIHKPPKDKRESRTRHKLQSCQVVNKLMQLGLKGIINIMSIDYEVGIDTSKHKSGGKLYIVDCLVKFTFEEEEFILLIESDISHFTSPDKLRELDYYFVMETNCGNLNSSLVSLVIRPTIIDCQKNTTTIPNLYYLTPNKFTLWLDNCLH